MHIPKLPKPIPQIKRPGKLAGLQANRTPFPLRLPLAPVEQRGRYASTLEVRMHGEVLHLPDFGDGGEVGFRFGEEVGEAGRVEGLVGAEEGEVGFLGGEEGAF